MPRACANGQIPLPLLLLCSASCSAAAALLSSQFVARAGAADFLVEAALLRVGGKEEKKKISPKLRWSLEPCRVVVPVPPGRP